MTAITMSQKSLQKVFSHQNQTDVNVDDSTNKTDVEPMSIVPSTSRKRKVIVYSMRKKNLNLGHLSAYQIDICSISDPSEC